MRLGATNLRSMRLNHAFILGTCVLIVQAGTATGAGRSRQSHAVISREYFEARSLFEKIWEPGKGSNSGGDGVGPLFNDRSCVGCHHLGGTGGAGDGESNVTILSALPGAPGTCDQRPVFRGELEDLHPGFHNRSSIVLHKHATSEADDVRLTGIRKYGFVQTRDDSFTLARSQRSTPALFGAGRIDKISDQSLLAGEARKFPTFPEIKGRVSRLRGGRLGKFGWKGQTASLEDFVMAACANELGLEVRGRHQPSLVPAREYDPKKIEIDLNDGECAQLIRFVANLPAPVVHSVGNAKWGFEVFKTTGCATCHVPSFGGVDGLYSDLLLHDLGDRVRAFGGGYGGGESKIVDQVSKSGAASTPSGEAGPNEWRTAPLWGIADSAPYLHDGRAATLHEAIVLHGGEAEKTTKRYTDLSFSDRQALLAFLHSHVAPSQPGRPADHATRTARGKGR
jgi:CxxC motif-containing protein (DUF1111 family)